MPLIKSKSKQAFGKNVASEMDAGKPQTQSLAIAYDVAKRSKKKKMSKGGMAKDCYAKGGEVLSAKYESRPMPDSEYNDEAMDKRNNGNKALKDSQWDDSPTIRQSQQISYTKLSQPKIVGGDTFSVRNRDMHDDEADMGNRMYPESDRAQPPSRDDEEGPKRQGPSISDNEKQHNNMKSAYEPAAETEYSEDEAEPSMKKVQSPLGRYAKGGPVMQPKDSGEELMERDDEMDMQSRLAPGKHGEQPKSSLDESHDYGMKPGQPDEASPHTGETEADMLRRHADELAYFSQGGRVDMEDMDADEEGADRDNSIADSIMRRKRMAKGGSVEDGQVDLEANSEESPNMEDQMSFQANGKEQYDLRQLDAQPMDSNEKGDERESDSENEHDMIDQIRSKMKAKKKI